MRVYRVSPILQYSPFYKLTYFSKLDFGVGNICEIDFNKRKIMAIVVESLSMDDAKVEIRSGNFKTKKIESKLESKIENFLNEKQFKLIEEFSNKFLISVGEVFFAMFSDVLNCDLSDSVINYDCEKITIYPDTLSKKVKSNFALRGLGDVVVSGKSLFQVLENLRKQNKLNDLKEIIIKDFNLEKYWGYQNPHISQIHLLFLYLELFDLQSRIKITLETNFSGVSENKFFEDNRARLDLALLESKNLAKKYIYKKSDQNKILDEEILEEIKEKKSFVFVLSHGFASRIYCKDCGENYKCENLDIKIGKCEGSYSVLNEQSENESGFSRFLFCKICKFKKKLLDDQYLICKKCGGWGMFPYGEGGQKVYQELLESGFTKEEIVFVDESEKKLSDKKIIEKVKEILKDDIKNLLGSKRVLKILQELKQEKLQTVVLSLGPLVKGKYFDSDEKFVQLLSEVENVSNEIYIGKNEGDEFVLDNFKNKEKFLEGEIKMRKDFNLPPYNNVVSFCFKYRDKKGVDSFLKNKELLRAGEIKKGNNNIYYWILSTEEIQRNNFFFESLRNLGQIVVSNFVYDKFMR